MELALEAASWGTMVRAAQEQSSARPWMTERVEIPPQPVSAKLLKRKKAAQTQELPAERWLPEQALTLPVRVWTPQMLRKR